MEAKEIAELITKQGENFEAFKAANEARLKAVEAGKSTSDFEAQIAKINDEFAEIRKGLNEAEKKANRPKFDGGESKADRDELNHALKTFGRDGDQSKLVAIHQKAMNSTSDPDGGFLVLPELDREIARVVPTISTLSRLATVKNISTSRYEKMVKTAGMAMRWVNEGATGGETTEPTYAKIAIDVNVGEVEPWVFNETLEDAIVDLAGDLAQEAGIGFAAGEGSAFITGNGVGKPRGIAAYTMVANASYAWGSVGYILSGATAGFAATAPSDKLISLQHALKAQYRPGAVWLMNDTTLGVARQMKDASGSYYLWNADPTGGFGGRFLGSPVEVDDNVADLGAGSLSVAYGNFRDAYTIVNRAGTTLIRDNITAKGITKFNFRRRLGGGISNYEAVKFLKCATS